MKDKIQNQLHHLGIPANYIGYYLMTAAVELALEDESRLLNITKEIYQPVASRYNCRHHTVERNIRTLIYRTWHMCPQRLIDMAGYPLQAPPTVSEFIDIFVAHIEKNYMNVK